MVDPAAALEGYEDFLATRASNFNANVRLQALAAGAHAEALWRGRGVKARARDGRSLARLAADACRLVGKARGTDIAGRLSEFSEPFWNATFVAYLCLLQNAADRAGPPPLPAAVLVPCIAPAAPGTAEGTPPRDRKASAGQPAPEPTGDELRAAVRAGCHFFSGAMSRVYAVRSLAEIAAGVGHSAKGSYSKALRCFARAAGMARATGQPRDTARALLLQAAHTEAAGERAALAASAAAAASQSGDQVFSGLARRVAAACAGPGAGLANLL
eukprot:tig00020693_g13039.t1